LPDPELLQLTGSYGIFVAGVGGTGVVTIGQLLGMAAHLEGKAGSVLDMAGLAQKGGAVFSHAIIAPTSADILNTRIALGQADLVLGADLVVGSSVEAVTRMRPAHTRMLLNADVAPTAAFISNPNWTLAARELRQELEQACGEGRIQSVDASEMAVKLLGDAVYANPLLMGFAYQQGWIPLHHRSLEQAIVLNGVQVKKNLEAFNWGRRAAHEPLMVARLLGAGHQASNPTPHGATVVEFKRSGSEVEQLREHRAAFLREYQNEAYASEYVSFVNRVSDAEMQACGTQRLTLVVARYLFKLMAYKDEYEVARLYTDGEFLRGLDEQFEGDWSVHFHLAPPLFSKRDGKGHLIKAKFGPRMLVAFRLLAKLKGLRGTWMDVFGYTAERRTERALIGEYRETVLGMLDKLSRGSLEKAVEVAGVPEEIRGYGHVKEAALVRAQAARARLLGEFEVAAAGAGGSRAA
jgi:indolepyruvate ferredoxin oxidoreductase